MNNFKRVSALALAGATLAMASGTSFGMGFGRPVSHAVLGEPLRVSVPLRLDAGEDLAGECVSAEVFFGDDRLAATLVQVSLAGTGRDAAITLRTNTPVTEPIVTYKLIAGCQTKVSRQFVELVDLPGMSLPVAHAAPITPVDAVRTSEVSPTRVEAPRRAAPAPAARNAESSTPRRATKAASAARASKVAPLARAVTEADESPATPRTSLTLAQAPAPSTAPSTGRLELDPVAAEAAVQPDLQMSGGLSVPVSADEIPSVDVQQRRAAAAALWQAMNQSPEDIARDRQKLLAQEQMLAKLAEDAQAAQRTSSAAAFNPSGDGSERGPSTLLYGVSALALLGVGLCAALYWKLRRRQQEEAAWWQSQMQEPVGEDDEAINKVDVNLPVAPAVQADAEPAQAQAREASSSSDVSGAPTASTVAAFAHGGTAAAMASAPASPVQAPLAARAGVVEHMREVSVEELIDLEQQAEFFVVLGQDDAAVDLLESHVHTVSASPLPFLKLLELYQRLNRRGDYERVQQAFNDRFNAHAPAWDADLQHGHELVDYPGIVERLQSLWTSPTQAMEVLEKSLTRPESHADTFELPAYRELLFLYAVARDLSERAGDERPRVDLFASEPGVHVERVPFDMSEHGSVIEPLMATRPLKAMLDAQPSLSLDLQLDDLEAGSKAQASDRKVPAAGKASHMTIDSEHIELDVDVAVHKP